MDPDRADEGGDYFDDLLELQLDLVDRFARTYGWTERTILDDTRWVTLSGLIRRIDEREDREAMAAVGAENNDALGNEAYQQMRQMLAQVQANQRKRG